MRRRYQLDFGTIVDKYLYLVCTLSQTFALHLTECDLSLNEYIVSGTENAKLPGLLALDAGSRPRGSASGWRTAPAGAAARSIAPAINSA